MRRYPNILSRSAATLIACLCLLPPLAGRGAAAELSSNAVRPPSLRAESFSVLQRHFQGMEYSREELDRGVPPFILETFPADLYRTPDISLKKELFFMGLMPMVLMLNREVEEQRREFTEILDKHRLGQTLSERDRNRVNELTRTYRLDGDPLTDQHTRGRLFRRIDIIPPDLVLAQAANESAWGTSRFARQGNNLFGEWTFQPGTGIVPDGRPPGETYEVRKFPSIYASLRSYMRNLNTNGAYRRLREIRAELRRDGKPLNGVALASGLHRYSQRGEAYIREIQAMIRQNKLHTLNTAVLREEPVAAEPADDGGGLISSRLHLTGDTPAPGEDP